MILLTGATGFVGNSVLKQLMQRSDFAIRTYGRKSPVDFPIASSFDNITHVIGDIREDADYTAALSGANVIIHCAARAHVMNEKTEDSIKAFREINTFGTLSFARQAAAAGVKRFVFVSSIGVNGTSTYFHPFAMDSIPNPNNFYAKSKYEAELGLNKIAGETGLEVVIVRPTLIYGPNAPGNFGMLTKLVHKMPVLPFGLANNRRDFISVQNLADLLVTCATHPNAGGHTFLASENETVSIKEFTNAIAKGLGKKVIQLPIPVSLMRLTGRLTGKSALIEQLFGNLEVNSSNTQQVLGWTPPLTMEQSMTSLKNLGNKQ
ncbi:MAG: NAD-dependent epimerase/dehydratase family protein [Plesiomonas shigelloides]